MRNVELYEEQANKNGMKKLNNNSRHRTILSLQED